MWCRVRIFDMCFVSLYLNQVETSAVHITHFCSTHLHLTFLQTMGRLHRRPKPYQLRGQRSLGDHATRRRCGGSLPGWGRWMAERWGSASLTGYNPAEEIPHLIKDLFRALWRTNLDHGSCVQEFVIVIAIERGACTKVDKKNKDKCYERWGCLVCLLFDCT